MTKRVFLVLALAVMLLLCALSTRGALFWLLFWTMDAMLVLGLVSVLWTSRTFTLRCKLSAERVPRGAKVDLTVRLRHMCPLPVAALRLTISAAADFGEYELSVPASPFIYNDISQALYCPHVGPYPASVSAVRIEDVFGLFRAKRKIKDGSMGLIVEPLVYQMEAPAFSPGDSDQDIAMARAFQDATLPVDVRAYQPGDELKKVHWKLSMRRQEILVRVFEQPMRPDALLLVDCAPPEAPVGADAANAAAAVRDAITEAAASVAAAALSAGAPVRMPLLADPPQDVKADKPEEIHAVTDALGRLTFNAAQQFERVLLLETRRLRRAGSTTIVTSRMNPIIADMVLRIRRMGPKVRVLLAADCEREDVAQVVTRLMQNDVEVVAIGTELA